MKYAILKTPVSANGQPAFSYHKLITLALFGLVLFFFPLSGQAQEHVKANSYDEIINYSEDFTKQTVHYKYKTFPVDQLSYDNWNENIDKRETNKIFWIDPVSGKKKFWTFTGDNFMKDGYQWYQVEYATTSEEIFFEWVDKYILPESYFDKMIGFLDFYKPAVAQLSTSTNSGDGYTRMVQDVSSWNDLINGAGNSSSYTSVSYGASLRASHTTNSWYYINKSYFPFYTNIGSGYQVDSATINLYGASASTDDWGLGVVLVNNTQADNSSLVDADYQQTGSVAYSDILTSWSTSGFNTFTLNSSGENNIDLEGWSKFALVPTPVQTDTEPTWSDYGLIHYVSYFLEQTGTAYDPYLEIYYSEISTSSPPTSTTTSQFSEVCDLNYIEDISIISSCREIYDSTSATPTQTIYEYKYIPAIQYFYIYSIIAILIAIYFMIWHMLYAKKTKK